MAYDAKPKPRPKHEPRPRHNHNTMSSLGHLRVPYSSAVFTEDQLVSKTDPFLQFQAWFEEARRCDLIKEPNAMSLATSTSNGKPSCRIVLMKHYDENGFNFFTNLEGRKGRELAENPFAAVVFFWPPLHRQVRIEGRVDTVPEAVSTQYFQSRPISSQVSATISRQSREVENREELARMHAELHSKVEESGQPLPKPDHWGGYCLVPSCFEFWQGQSNRLHDRLVFVRSDDGWRLKRLAP